MKKFRFLILVAAACALVACNEKPNKGEAGDYTLSWDLQTVLTSGGTVDSVVMAVNGKHVRTLTDAADGMAPLVWTTIRSARWAHPSTTMCVAWFHRF